MHKEGICELIHINKNYYIKYLTVLIIYTIIIVYSMLFGFERPQLALKQEYRYWLILDRIPLWIPSRFSLDTIKIWVIFTLGNLLAFVPFGLLLPKVFKRRLKTFFKVIVVFLAFIISMEIIQMITYLGVFDVSDIFINTMGVIIGYCSHSISKRMKTMKQKAMAIALTIFIMSIFLFAFAELYNTFITPYFEM